MNISLQVLFFLALLILLAKAAGGLAARVGLPAVLGELLAGVVLGPTFINVWKFSWFAVSAPVGDHATVSLAAFIRVLAELGVVVLMFLAGLETDISAMKKAFGPAFWAACGGVVLPFVGSAVIGHELGFAWRESIFIGTILTATSVSITAQTLMNLKQLRSKAGATILAAAVIDDVLGLLVLSLVIAAESHMANTHSGGSGLLSFGWTVARMVVFFLFAFLLGPRLIRLSFRVARHFRVEHTSLAAALAKFEMGKEIIRLQTRGLLQVVQSRVYTAADSVCDSKSHARVRKIGNHLHNLFEARGGSGRLTMVQKFQTLREPLRNLHGKSCALRCHGYRCFGDNLSLSIITNRQFKVYSRHQILLSALRDLGPAAGGLCGTGCHSRTLHLQHELGIAQGSHFRNIQTFEFGLRRNSLADKVVHEQVEHIRE